ncbi:MAG: hypothetical protein LQ348_002450 [Seirophora lacunosa]|nr:MAG: hypothetical protein LQ348_002450 [Seirophora lacunosa]
MSIPYFASPFRHPHPGSVGGLQHRPRGKRKRGVQQAEEPDANEGGDPSPEPFQNDNPEVVLSRPSFGLGLRRQHYDVLTSLLHRCILEEDYARASRAWGMLLRIELAGYPLDIRLHDRWGIGAELLLHADSTLSGRKSIATGRISTHDRGITIDEAKSAEKGLLKAKDYYERLILQFPFRKTSPESTSSLTFYPVLFSIWIHSIQLRYKLARQVMIQDGEPSDDADSNNYTRSGNEPLDPEATRSQFDSNAAARQSAFQDANVIIGRLEELLVSPPYSDLSGLWKIKGMLLLWTCHLVDHQMLSTNYSDNSGHESVTPPREYEHSESQMRSRPEAILKAREAFSRALSLGDTLNNQSRQAVGL